MSGGGRYFRERNRKYRKLDFGFSAITNVVTQFCLAEQLIRRASTIRNLMSSVSDCRSGRAAPAKSNAARHPSAASRSTRRRYEMTNFAIVTSNKFGYFVPDLHQLLRPELLQRRLADERDQRDVLAEEAHEIQAGTKEAAKKWSRHSGAALRQCLLAAGVFPLCISLLSVARGHTKSMRNAEQPVIKGHETTLFFRRSLFVGLASFVSFLLSLAICLTAPNKATENHFFTRVISTFSQLASE